LSSPIGRIDDRKPAMTKPDAAILRKPLAKSIGAARGHMIAYAGKLRTIDAIRRGAVRINSTDTAHFSLAPGHKRLRDYLRSRFLHVGDEE
jgi:hypothetical protein